MTKGRGIVTSRGIGATTAALIAFAANSVLCRIALRQGTLDPATFTTIRLFSGAVVLLLIAAWVQRRALRVSGSWTSAGLLALYALPFAYAYTGLTTGTGALILFGSVQVALLLAALGAGERPHVVQWVGFSLALSGLVVLVFPGLTAPPLLPAVLMAIAGAAWGDYTWRGRRTANPLIETTSNFVRATPLVAAVSLVTLSRAHVEPKGVVLSVASGAVASGLGYVAWYAALRGLTGMQAAILQLSVPVLAAAGGVIFLMEAITARLVLSTILVLGGIALAIVGRERLSQRRRT